MNQPTAHSPVSIPPLHLPGDLRIPPEPRALIIFAHGSGSSRLSPRNREVARAFGEAGMATLLFDLLTEDEAAERANVFDIELLAQRLVYAIDWAHAQPALAHLPIGLFGASTGAAAALMAAVARSRSVEAVVSRGGRPDLAADALAKVTAPTLLIVGGLDEPVLSWNRAARERLAGPSQLEVVPGATHLFEEPGALEEVVSIARNWFDDQLRPVRRGPSPTD